MATLADRLPGFPRWVVEQYWIETGRSLATAPAHPLALRRAYRTARALLPQVAHLTGTPSATLDRYLRELRRGGLRREIGVRCPKATGIGSPHAEILYLFVRASRPSVVVETGVHLGVSSAHILQALADNVHGELWSVDLPTVGSGYRVNEDGRIDRAHLASIGETGSAVPERLRSRWHLTLGDAKELLPTLPAPPVWDLFFHDSDHSRAHMLWEFGVAWSRLRDGGLLLSDDVPDNDAFLSFAREVGATPFLWLRRGTIRRGPSRPDAPDAGPPASPPAGRA